MNKGTFSIVPFPGTDGNRALIFSDQPGYHYAITLDSHCLQLANMEIEAAPSTTYTSF